jgi:hypothetical protein
MPGTAAHLTDPEKLRRWKRRALDKGQQLAKELEKLMAGLEVRLEHLGPGMPPYGDKPKRERVRKYLDQVDRVVKSFDAGTYGRCADCREAIDETRLEEMPWTERCARCFAEALKDGRI